MRQPEIVYCTFYLQSYQLNIDFGTSSVQRFLLVFLSIVISGYSYVIQQLQYCAEVDMMLNGLSRYCFLWSIKPDIDLYTRLLLYNIKSYVHKMPIIYF
jgi:hypothetical protein